MESLRTGRGGRRRSGLGDRRAEAGPVAGPGPSWRPPSSTAARGLRPGGVGLGQGRDHGRDQRPQHDADEPEGAHPSEQAQDHHQRVHARLAGEEERPDHVVDLAHDQRSPRAAARRPLATEPESRSQSRGGKPHQGGPHQRHEREHAHHEAPHRGRAQAEDPEGEAADDALGGGDGQGGGDARGDEVAGEEPRGARSGRGSKGRRRRRPPRRRPSRAA